jgi:predicted DNA-binding protein (MmcQ/YjbR family)
MDSKPLQAYLLNKKGVTEETPFGPETLVFKVMGKMFALLAWQDSPLRITLKSDPDLAQTLRAQYPAIQPGYYMNKKHWNTVTLDDTVPAELAYTMIDNSYRLVAAGLPKTARKELETSG